MPLHYGPRLTETVRSEMVRELHRKIAESEVQFDSRVAMSNEAWLQLLETAVIAGSVAWLESQLEGKLHASERGRTRTGRVVVRKVPDTAAQLIAENEFNRLYAAAICRMALAKHGPAAQVRVYRAKPSTVRRWRPYEFNRSLVSASQLLSSLRRNERELIGLGRGNSGLSVELV